MEIKTSIRPLLLLTRESLLLQVVFEREGSFTRWTATLHLLPDRRQRDAGLQTGPTVATAWSEKPPTFLASGSDDIPDTAVFVGKAMFSMHEDQANLLRSYIIQQTEAQAEAWI